LVIFCESILRRPELFTKKLSPFCSSIDKKVKMIITSIIINIKAIIDANLDKILFIGSSPVKNKNDF
jgi:hypothetical protein